MQFIEEENANFYPQITLLNIKNYETESQRKYKFVQYLFRKDKKLESERNVIYKCFRKIYLIVKYKCS